MPLGMPVMRKLVPSGVTVRLSSSLASWVWPSRKRRGERRSSSCLAGMRCACGVAGGIEPGKFAVEDEDLAGWLVWMPGRIVDPAHAAGFFEQEGAGFGALHAHAGVMLGVAGAEGVEMVVVVVDFMDDGGVLREQELDRS